jgi:hypothetical protein
MEHSFKELKYPKLLMLTKSMNKSDWDKNSKMKKILLYAKESKMEHAM